MFTRNPEEFYIVFSFLSQPPQHMSKSSLLEILSYSYHFRLSKGFSNRQEMKWSVMWDLSVHNTSLPFDHRHDLDKLGLEICLRSPVSRKRNQKPPLGLFVLFLRPPTVQLEDVSQHHELRHKQHTNSCKQRVHNLHVLILLYSCYSGSFQTVEFLIPRIILLFLFRHLHEIPPLARCHHQWVLHLG